MKNEEKNAELHVSHDEHHDLMSENEHLRKELDALKATNAELHDIVEANALTIINNVVLADLLEHLSSAIDTIASANLDAITMTSAQRRRLQGAGVRRYGFIEKTADISEINQQFFPGFFTHSDLHSMNLQIEKLRNLMSLTQQILRILTDHYLLTSDEAYRLSRLYYVSVRDAARNGVAGALPLFNILRPLFRRSSGGGEEPTEPEIERDVRALLHGHKDGRIVIENERPHLVGGKHVVVDETQKPKGAFKETEKGESSKR
jgi:hypothetical protein